MQALRAAEFFSMVQRLGDVLAGDDGWCSVVAPGTSFPHAGGSLNEVPLGRYAGVGAVFIDIPPDRPFPGYSERREIQMNREAAGGPRVSILSNAAGSRLICCWRERDRSGALVFREEPMPRRARLQLALLTTAAHAAALRACAPPASPAPEIHRRLLQLTRPEAFQPTWSAEQARDAVIAMIEGATSPSQTRRVWRNLARIKLFDRDCQEGSWLTAGAAALKPLYESSLRRMAGWLADSMQQTPGSSPALRDFRRLEDLVSVHGVENLTNHLVLFNNIHGIGRQALHAECTRLRIAIVLHPEAGCDAFPQLAVRIIFPPAASRDDHRGSATDLCHHERLADDAAELRRVQTILRDLQLHGRSTAAQLIHAYSDLAVRLTAADADAGEGEPTSRRSRSDSVAERLFGIDNRAHTIMRPGP